MELLARRLAIDDLDGFVSRLSEIGATHGVTIQAFDARYVAGEGHLEHALELADRAIERGEAVARDRGVEILLYAAGRRQIDRALEMGVSEGECEAVVLVASERGGDEGEGDDADEAGAVAAIDRLEAVVGSHEAVGSGDKKVLTEFFSITPAEREATDAPLSLLVRERVALLVVER